MNDEQTDNDALLAIYRRTQNLKSPPELDQIILRRVAYQSATQRIIKRFTHFLNWVPRPLTTVFVSSIVVVFLLIFGIFGGDRQRNNPTVLETSAESVRNPDRQARSAKKGETLPVLPVFPRDANGEQKIVPACDGKLRVPGEQSKVNQPEKNLKASDD